MKISGCMLAGMYLKPYLRARGESYSAFGRRCKPPQSSQTIGNVARGATVPLASLAHIIITASREEPAPDGGTVTLEDLGFPPQRESAA